MGLVHEMSTNSDPSSRSTYITFCGNIKAGMGKIRRGGYVFITYKGDHDPRHVHIYRDGKFVAKWNLDAWVLMSGAVNGRIIKILEELVRGGLL